MQCDLSVFFHIPQPPFPIILGDNNKFQFNDLLNLSYEKQWTLANIKLVSWRISTGQSKVTNISFAGLKEPSAVSLHYTLFYKKVKSRTTNPTTTHFTMFPPVSSLSENKYVFSPCVFSHLNGLWTTYLYPLYPPDSMSH